METEKAYCSKAESLRTSGSLRRKKLVMAKKNVERCRRKVKEQKKNSNSRKKV